MNIYEDEKLERKLNELTWASFSGYASDKLKKSQP